MASTDQDAISTVVKQYYEGLYHMDEARLRRAFHPAACLFGHLRSAFTHSTLDQWLEKIRIQPAPSRSNDPYDMQVLSIDIAGTAATAKVSELYRGLRFTDYLTLLKLDGTWVIVNKAYHHD
jgi:hypothetical protein